MVTIVYDNSEATELCAAQHLYLKPIAKLIINVLLPEMTEPVRPFSNWEVLDQLKSLICPDQFTTVRLSKSTKDFIRFEVEAETKSLVQILKAKLHGKMIKLNGLKTDLKVVTTDAQGEWEPLPKEKEASLSDGGDEQDLDKSPDSIHFEGLPCKWFAPKDSNGDKPCEEILRVVFESFGKIKNVDIPMLDPYREEMTGGSFGGFSIGLQTFDAFIQYQESTDFIKAMESLRGMKLVLKGDDGKALACNMKVKFDTTKHFSERAIRRRNQERLELQELEEERKKEKKREEEKTERKRKEEKRKAQERKRKARVRRQALKERNGHQQRRQKDRAKAETSQEPYSGGGCKDRQYQLAQRKVEALRLLRVLLRKIAFRLFAGRSSFLGSSNFSLREIDTAANSVLEDIMEMPREEDLNILYRQNCEERLKYQVAKPDNKQKQNPKKRTRADLHESPHHLGENINSSPRNEEFGNLLTYEYDDDFFSDKTTLKITLIEGSSPEKEDSHSSSNSCSPTVFEQNHGRKKKIYETDEFFSYILNYYQSPKYPRVRLETNCMTNYCQWQRAVLAKENGIQVNLRKLRCPSCNLSQVQNLEEREEVQNNYYWPKSCPQSPQYNPPKRRHVEYTGEHTKEFQNFKVTVSGTSGHLSPTMTENRLLEKTQVSEINNSKSIKENQVSSPKRPENLYLELNDFFEEISSDSECFSEILSINEEKEKSVTSAHSSPQGRYRSTNKSITYDHKVRSSHQTSCSKWEDSSDSECFSEILSINEEKEKSVTSAHSSPQGRYRSTNKSITYDHKVRSSHQTSCSKWEDSSDSECFSEILSISEEKEKSVTSAHSSPQGRYRSTNKSITYDHKVRSSHQTSCSKWEDSSDEEEYSTYQLIEQDRSSRDEMRYSWLEGENHSFRYENDRRKWEVQSPSYLSDEGYYYESTSSDPLNDVTTEEEEV